MLTVIGSHERQGSLRMFETRLPNSFISILQQALFKSGFILTKMEDLSKGFRFVTDAGTVEMYGSFCAQDVVEKCFTLK